MPTLAPHYLSKSRKRLTTDESPSDPGRFAWVLSDIVPLPSPIPAKGSQGVWTTMEQAVCRIAEEIRARHAAGLPRQEALF